MDTISNIILVDTIFNYIFVGLPGQCLQKNPEITEPAPNMCVLEDFSKDMFLDVQNEKCS